MRNNPIIEGRGQELALTRFQSHTEEPVKGIFARLPRNEAQLRAAFSVSGAQVWTTGISFPKDVEFVTVTGQGRDAGKYRVIDHERIVGAFVTERYALQDVAMT